MSGESTTIHLKFTIVSLLLVHFIYDSQCQRRIMNGVDVEGPKGFMVYLYAMNQSYQNYDYWICGGALVTPEYIITSAACVSDTRFTHAIVAYKNLTYRKDMETDNCTRNFTRNIVFTCVPQPYKLQFDKLNVWANADIAIAKLDQPFDIGNDSEHKSLCGDTPTLIDINYDPKYQRPGTDALFYGWGHTSKWRHPSDIRDLNQKRLKYGRTEIMPLKDCLKYFERPMWAVISKYMICTYGFGNIDERGDVVPIEKDEKDKRLFFGCNSSDSCFSHSSSRAMSMSKASGLCQNDHGGPLTTFIGRREVIIGVASVFRVNRHRDCTGPYLFTSTACMGTFIDCNIYPEAIRRTLRGRLCDLPPKDKGYELIEKHYSWDNSEGDADMIPKSMPEKHNDFRSDRINFKTGNDQENNHQNGNEKIYVRNQDAHKINQQTLNGYRNLQDQSGPPTNFRTREQQPLF